MSIRRLTLVVSAACAFAAPADARAGDAEIRVEEAWARRAAMMTGSGAKAGSGNGAVYATVSNLGKTPDALVAAASDAAEVVEIHETYRDMGMSMMRPVKGIAVAAGGKVMLKPGGYHIMLINLKRDLKAGETLRLTLKFQNAGAVPVSAIVK